MVSYNTFRNRLMYKHYSINPPKIPILNGISIVRLQIGQLVPVCIQRSMQCRWKWWWWWHISVTIISSSRFVSKQMPHSPLILIGKGKGQRSLWRWRLWWLRRDWIIVSRDRPWESGLESSDIYIISLRLAIDWEKSRRDGAKPMRWKMRLKKLAGWSRQKMWGVIRILGEDGLMNWMRLDWRLLLIGCFCCCCWMRLVVVVVSLDKEWGGVDEDVWASFNLRLDWSTGVGGLVFIWIFSISIVDCGTGVRYVVDVVVNNLLCWVFDI